MEISTTALCTLSGQRTLLNLLTAYTKPVTFIGLHTEGYYVILASLKSLGNLHTEVEEEGEEGGGGGGGGKGGRGGEWEGREGQGEGEEGEEGEEEGEEREGGEDGEEKEEDEDEWSTEDKKSVLVPLLYFPPPPSQLSFRPSSYNYLQRI